MLEAPYDPWPDYRFTGPLRPAPYGPRRAVPAHIPRPDYADDGVPHSEMDPRRGNTAAVLTPAEAAQMRAVCRMGREILDAAARAVRPGVTTDELDAIVHEETVRRGAYPSPLNYSGFPRSCCTSVNEVICHGIPDRRPLVDGDIVNIDVTVYHGGFHGDLNETYVVGQTDAASLRLVNCARDALAAAIEVVRPGTPYREVGNVIERLAKARGFSVVKAYCGHGIHRLFHTVPTVPHYARSKAVGVMRAGHVFTIEPMINAGSWQDARWPDEWTAVTVDGRRSAQFEHTLLVTDDGCEVLTAPLADSPAAPRA